MSDFNPIGALTEDEKRKIISPSPMPQKNETKFIVGLTGPAAAGKEVVSGKLKEAGFNVFIFSDILRREAQSRGLLKGDPEEDRMILSKIGDIVRFISGKKEILAEVLVREIMESSAQKFAVSGFRTEEEVFLFRKHFKNFRLVHVDAPAEVRFQRRLAEDPKATMHALNARDENDIKNKGMDKVFRMAEARIQNDGDLERLYAQVGRILNGF